MCARSFRVSRTTLEWTLEVIDKTADGKTRLRLVTGITFAARVKPPAPARR